MTRVLVGMSMALAFACATACRDTAPPEPPELRLGVDLCDGCGMTIVEPRYAAAALADDGAGPRVVKFDDIGCFARWEARASGTVIQRRWVHDHSTEMWIDTSTATFAQIRGLMTPMGSGIAAFKDVAEAEAVGAERGGETLRWETILDRVRDGTLQRHSAVAQGEPR